MYCKSIFRKRMFRIATFAGPSLLVFVFACGCALSQPKPAAASSLAGLEFPVTMRQNVVAGKTPVGTKVEAKLTVATLVHGVVVPQDAVLSGEVIESMAKAGTEPSRLAIRIESAHWKSGSTVLKLYLTAWYYPLELARDLSDNPADASHSPRGSIGIGGYPDSNPRGSPPFPGPDIDKNTVPAAPSPRSNVSEHRVLMKNTEAIRGSDGSIILTSKHANIKLDKQTVYVLADAELLPAK